ncbi:MAG TPA: monovalent cation/H(+) antiporter subunit G [Gaiellaceae bacterium]
MSDLAVDVLLVLGVTAQLICCVGVAVMRTTADRLHYTSAGYTVGPFCVLAALLVREQLSSIGLDAIAAVGLVFLAGPIVTHATARALRRIDFGKIDARPAERVD